MLEATLDKEVAETIDHEWERLVDDRLHDFVLLVRSADLQFLSGG